MDTIVSMDTLSINKAHQKKLSSAKYDIQVALDEIENSESLSKIKYSFTLLSDPKNIRIATEGVATIAGSNEDRMKVFEEDENAIPKLVHSVYQELFPVLFMTTKNMQIPCPPYKLSNINSAEDSEQVSNQHANTQIPDMIPPDSEILEQEKAAEPEINAQPDVVPPDSENVETEKAAEPEINAQPDVVPPDSENAEPAMDEQKPDIIPPVSQESPNFEEMSDDKLREVYSKLSEDYSKNPSQEILEKMSAASTVLNSRSEKKTIAEAP